MLNKEKTFRDPIYGYISIPEKYCNDFIDTSIFQRLRRIEQTSMRVLYPSAHHDRFAHSIGVFYLGQLAFHYLRKNSEEYFEFSNENWAKYKNSFEIACLMHDCGHSPFSHTFEHFYLYKKENEIKNKLITYFASEQNFQDEYKNASPAPHEKISALILLEHFSDKIKENEASPELIARMIMGCKYESGLNSEKRFENRLISLLNGVGIDVDSLDYIQRDSWASGVSNVKIDYQRLLSALMIKTDSHNSPKIVFKKSALSVLDNISIGRNFLYKWIYSHHKVIYEQYLLTNIIDQINKKTKEQLCPKIFSTDSFSSAQTFKNSFYFLPSDDDIIYTIKQYREITPLIDEFLSRNYKYKALWKTYFEFNEVYLSSISISDRMKIYTKLSEKENILSKTYGEDKFLCLKAEPKLKRINSNDFFIDVDGKLIDAARATSIQNENLNYFMIYVTKDLLSEKDKIIDKILSLQS